MKNLIFAISIFSYTLMHSQETEVRKTIDIFFEAFHKRDTIMLKTVLGNEMRFQSISEKQGGSAIKTESAQNFLISIAGIPPKLNFEEKLLSYKISSDGSLAHVWTPYEFYLDAKLSHSGVNSFTLFKENGFWKIVYCIDTRRK